MFIYTIFTLYMLQKMLKIGKTICLASYYSLGPTCIIMNKSKSKRRL